MGKSGGEVSGIKLDFDKTQANRLLGYLDGIDGGAEKALYRTVVATQKKAKVEASKKIRSQLLLSKAYVDSKIALGKVSYSNLSGRIYASKRGILMTRFAYRKAKKGYDVKIKAGKYQNLPGAFLLPKLKNSNVPGLAIRKNGKLKMLYAPSPSQALSQHLPALQKQMSKFMLDRLEKEASSILRRQGY